MRNIEVQFGQLAQELHRRAQGGLPSNIVANPKGKEQCVAISLRSGTILEYKGEKSAVSEENAAREFDIMKEEVKACSKEEANDDNEARLGENNVEAEKEIEESKVSTRARKKKEELSPWTFLDFILPLPFPTTAKVKI